MNAVVRRLARWQERREAKRVQSVYEALEREHEECTFEPSINRLGGGGTGDDRSRSHSGGDHGKDVEDVSRKQQQQQRASSGGRAESPSHYAPLCRRDSHRRSTSTASYETDGAEYVPSLLPPTQPVYGAAAFIERLRGAREERDAVTAAAEAKRLHYYDSTSFTRGVTVPVPFELGDSRPRRVASSTAAVPGVPSPLARLRAAAGVGMSFTETGDGGSRGTPLQASSPSRVGLTPPAGVAKRGGNNCSSNSATLTRSLFSHMLGRGPRVEEEDEDGWTTPSASAAAAAVQYEYAGEEEEGEERLTAENTFLSLAPQIRETLLFDQGMAQQLHRATESIRRGVV
ncbi:hypothetical protein ABB37_07138 [Leptomonas pyrrhocoris]|uniref:Uncharacterized protein n=1 Tax=Leptomonas pyrrhocoris TaxID=157538 RepID=A0A0N0VE78_LEPPY|nr:hypothetical protein ABB37_07138 [Leptomonas pyrrhocoris]KPA77232.1 hypothetical protein ABB37_07138 [Leptomonas pyrrhocoris]|eukprot:XP_015655671.1 hypothetical protein ABB37_07138 [Leptomonas pyrrhocoris]